MKNFSNIIIHNVLTPLALPVTLLILALLIRLWRFMWFHHKQKGFPPIRIQASSDVDSSAFAARLSWYLAQDALDADIIIPPGGHGAEAAYPVERLGGTTNWLSTLIRVALSAEPAFEVSIKFVRDQAMKPTRQAIARTTRTPGSRVVVAATIRDESEEYLVRRVGCAISHSIRQTRTVRSHTPRWERWSAELDGYFAYRSALDNERLGAKKYKLALKQYTEAISHEPGNFVISMRRAALLELMHRYGDAVKVYRTCTELWPENIEATYRLAAALSNSEHFDEASKVLEDLDKRLSLIVLWKEWWKTWYVTCWNSGERSYWRDWLRRRPIIVGTSKRTVFKNAVQLGLVAADVAKLASDGTVGTDEMRDLLQKVMKLIRRREFFSTPMRLFHPNRSRKERGSKKHPAAWHSIEDDKDLRMYPAMLRDKPKSRIGWLAHYNAAIFFSVALRIPEHALPFAYDKGLWRADCARAAILELGYVKRDPRNQLEPGWYRTDPGLRSLREYLKTYGVRWPDFVGIPTSDSGLGFLTFLRRAFRHLYHFTSCDKNNLLYRSLIGRSGWRE